jgi:uncharacterized membrane protein
VQDPNFAALFMELMIGLVALAATIIGAYLGTGARKVQRSKEAQNYARAIEEFSGPLWAVLVALGTAAVERLEDEADEFAEGDRYDYIKAGLLDFIHQYAHKTGVKADELISEEQLDALIRTALVEGRKAFKEAFKE